VLRHEFRPGRLVAGAFFALAGVIYAGDAGGLWETPWFVVIPVVVAGLCLAGATGVVARTIRRRHGPSRHSAAPGTGAGTGTGTTL
jgi:drug/metabolite transporter (DMT)-like permease